MSMVYLVYQQICNEFKTRGWYYGLSPSYFWIVSQGAVLSIPMHGLRDWILVHGKYLAFRYDALETDPLLQAHPKEDGAYQLLGLSASAREALYAQLIALDRLVEVRYA